MLVYIMAKINILKYNTILIQSVLRRVNIQDLSLYTELTLNYSKLGICFCQSDVTFKPISHLHRFSTFSATTGNVRSRAQDVVKNQKGRQICFQLIVIELRIPFLPCELFRDTLKRTKQNSKSVHALVMVIT